MQRSPEPNSANTPQSNSEQDEPTLEQSLQDLEQALQALKERYVQIQEAEERQIALKNRIDDVRQNLRQSPTQPLKAELKKLQEQLDEVEFTLESRLIKFSSFSEPFWQAVRFGGVGIVIGWLFRSLT